jgi:hypothetical protein
MSDERGTEQTIETGPAQTSHHDEHERRGWQGFRPWLATTLILAVLAAGLWWHLENREPQIVEIAGPTPPRADPAPELVQRAAQLGQIIALRQHQLGEQIAALNPPQCTPPAIVDLALLEKVRRQEAPNISRWRALLVPVNLAPGANQVMPGTVTPAQDAPPLQRRSPGTTSDGTDTDRRAMLAPSPPITGSDIAALSIADMRSRLESISAIVIGLKPGLAPELMTGSAFFISPNMLVTNRHVIEGAGNGDLFVASGRLQTVQAVEIVAMTPPAAPGDLDFAVLRLKSGRAPEVAPIAVGSKKLAPVIAAGYPGMGLGRDAGFHKLIKGNLSAAPDLNMNRGEIRSIRRLGQITRIVHTADVMSGYSGGPLVDICGRIVGINTFIEVDQTQAAKLNNAIAAEDLVSFLRQSDIEISVDARRCNAG